MEPPVWTMYSKIKNDPRYLRKIDTLWWKCSSKLYSGTRDQYYRDPNFLGSSTYWGRGNGWVIAGLSRVLKYMPSGYFNRGKFSTQFTEMCAAVKKLQEADGMWRTDLLNPNRFPDPESSCTGFFCFGFAHGMNTGILTDATYAESSKRAWEALVKKVDRNGRSFRAERAKIMVYPVLALTTGR